MTAWAGVTSAGIHWDWFVKFSVQSPRKTDTITTILQRIFITRSLTLFCSVTVGAAHDEFNGRRIPLLIKPEVPC